jgi:uncharacterized protein (TIGR03435 family)
MKQAFTAAATGIFLASSVFAQAASTPPAFEVADIKPTDPANPMDKKGRMLPGGRIEVGGMTVKDFVVLAYGAQDNIVVGGPKWVETERFDLVAKAPTDVPMPTLRLMVQTLLAERFKLAIHREDRPMPAYVLSVGKRAPKYHEGSGGQQTCRWQNPGDGLRRRECQNFTMAEFATQLPYTGGIGINLPVVDETGLKGAYDFQFEVGMPGGRNEGGNAPANADSGPTIFAALDQIGLKLEPRKMPVSVIVIDHVESPTKN